MVQHHPPVSSSVPGPPSLRGCAQDGLLHAAKEVEAGAEAIDTLRCFELVMLHVVQRLDNILGYHVLSQAWPLPAVAMQLNRPSVTSNCLQHTRAMALMLAVGLCSPDDLHRQHSRFQPDYEQHTPCLGIHSIKSPFLARWALVFGLQARSLTSLQPALCTSILAHPRSSVLLVVPLAEHVQHVLTPDPPADAEERHCLHVPLHTAAGHDCRARCLRHAAARQGRCAACSWQSSAGAEAAVVFQAGSRPHFSGCLLAA